MGRILYNCLWTLVLPIFTAVCAIAPRYRVLLGRVAPWRAEGMVQLGGERPLWMHACSVGEFAIARTLIAAIRREMPGLPMLLTLSTPTGFALAQRDPVSDATALFPLDHPWVVRRFLDIAQPCGLVLLETEFWPNVLLECNRRRVPIILANGRISSKHFGRYLRLRAFYRRPLQSLDAACMQTQVDADRIRRLGVPAKRIHRAGNIKYDGARMVISRDILDTLEKECGISPGDSVVVFGSTHRGDEHLAAQCVEQVGKAVPDVVWIIAPRHLNRLGEVRKAFEGFPYKLRSEAASVPAEMRTAARIWIVDTYGELAGMYGVARIAVIGGSFYPGVGGHNPIEPAALGLPVIFGPHMENFREPARRLVEASGAAQVTEPGQVPEALVSLLGSPAELQRMGAAGREVVRRLQGATERHMRIIKDLLGPRTFQGPG